MLAIEILRGLSIMLWLLVALRLLIPASRAFTRNARNMDPVWAMFALLSINRLWFMAVSFTNGEMPQIAQGLNAVGYIMAMALAIGILTLFRWYETREP